MTNFIFSKVAGFKSTGPLKNDLRHIHTLRILPRSYHLSSKHFSVLLSLFYLGFTPCKTEEPLRGKELQEKEAQKD